MLLFKLLACYFFLISTCLMSQVEIDLSAKPLHTELQKAMGVDVKFNELIIPPTMVEDMYFGRFYHVEYQSTNYYPSAYVYIGRVNTCRAGGCSINIESRRQEASEFFNYFILFDSTATVKLVKIYNYEASHGQEITSTSWLKQFKNHQGKNSLVVGKNVDAISGATISVEAITYDIETKTNLLSKLIK